MNGVYTRFLHRRYTNTADIIAGTLKCLLLRDTGTYVFNQDHDFVADIFANGGVEITVASYARQTLGGKVITLDDANDRSVLDFNDIAFGNLEAGQTVAALVFFEFITNDAASPLMYFIDGKIKVTVAAPLASGSTSGAITGATTANPVVITSNGHGLTNGQKVFINNVIGEVELNNRVFTVAGAATNTFQLSGINGTAYTPYISGGNWSLVQAVYVDKLKEGVNDGTAVTLGAVTGVVRGNSLKGDRILNLSAVSGPLNLGDNGIVQSAIALPAVLGAGAFNAKINVSGFLALPSTY
jgi:hypothetical protein